MARHIISTPEAPEYPSYSQAVKVGNTIYVAGTVGVDVATGELAGPTIKEQARQSMLNCQTILRAGAAELGDVVMVHTLLLHSEDADGVNEIFDEFFPDVRPPRCVSKLGVNRPGILISNAMVAVTD
jgi:2-iminobutanoate/2-iminopropanoate deaminase